MATFHDIQPGAEPAIEVALDVVYNTITDEVEIFIDEPADESSPSRSIRMSVHDAWSLWFKLHDVLDRSETDPAPKARKS